MSERNTSKKKKKKHFSKKEQKWKVTLKWAFPKPFLPCPPRSKNLSLTKENCLFHNRNFSTMATVQHHSHGSLRGLSTATRTGEWEREQYYTAKTPDPPLPSRSSSASTRKSPAALILRHLSAPKAGATVSASCRCSTSTSLAQCPAAPTHGRWRPPSKCAHQREPFDERSARVSWSARALSHSPPRRHPHFFRSGKSAKNPLPQLIQRNCG